LSVSWDRHRSGVDRHRTADHPGFKEDFAFDLVNHTATCPRGITGPPWKRTLGDQQPRFWRA